MVWNQPENNRRDYDPWSSGKNNEYINESRYKKGPPDLDDIFNKLSLKLSKFYSKNNNSYTLGKNNFYISILIILLITIWICSGFYTIKEAERGVVLRFGKFSHLVQPGLNWKPTLIDTVKIVNVESVRELAAAGVMLTSDENVVRVEMNVQYRVTNPKYYLFSVINPDDSLRQATDSALRGVIGKYTMDRILTEGRTLVRSDTQRTLEETIQPYEMGITLLDVNFQAARPPEEVKAAFDDTIAARENEQQYIREAEAYANEVQPRANGQAQRILEEGRAYKARTIMEAQGEVQRFTKILPEYKAAPEITRERLYIDTMERILSNTSKILINDNNNNNVMILPLEKIIRNASIKNSKFNLKEDVINMQNSILPNKTSNSQNKQSIINYNQNNKPLIDQRLINIQRDQNTKQEKKE